jgi:hypothetical protein
MLRKTLATTGGLIGLYLVLEYWVGFSNDVKSGAAAASTVVKTLQART